MKALRTIAAATRDALALAGLAAVAGFYAAERSWLWLLPATLLLCGIWYCVYKIREIVLRRVAPVKRSAAAYGGSVSLGYPKMRKRFRTAALASNSGSSPQGNRFAFARPPKSAQRTYILTEGGVPVGVEYDRRAVDNWCGLGPEFDALPQDIRS